MSVHSSSAKCWNYSKPLHLGSKMDIYLHCISFQFWNTFVLILKHFCIQIYIVIQVECFKFLLLLLLIQVECFKFLLLLLLSFHSHSEWALSLTGLDLMRLVFQTNVSCSNYCLLFRTWINWAFTVQTVSLHSNHKCSQYRSVLYTILI